MYRATLLAALISGSSALADSCHDLWFTRNLVMDRAGYCFGSVLGQAQFDNSDCIGKSVSLAPFWSDFVAQIQRYERDFACRVNTRQPGLALNDSWIRRRLTQLPIADAFESACLGWLGPQTPLYAGYDGVSPVVGTISPGNYVGFGHLPVGQWTYVTASGPDYMPLSGGWLFGPVPQHFCADWAG